MNVPAIMGWVFSMMKLFLSKETVRKFYPLGSGGQLAVEMPGVGKQLPKKYGGDGEELGVNGEVVRLASTDEKDVD